MKNAFVIIKIKWGQAMPVLLKPVGVIYNDDDGIIIVMGDNIEEASSIDLEGVEFESIPMGDDEEAKSQAADEYNKSHQSAIEREDEYWAEDFDAY